MHFQDHAQEQASIFNLSPGIKTIQPLPIKLLKTPHPPSAKASRVKAKTASKREQCHPPYYYSVEVEELQESIPPRTYP